MVEPMQPASIRRPRVSSRTVPERLLKLIRFPGVEPAWRRRAFEARADARR
jgi:hypothetical protein